MQEEQVYTIPLRDARSAGKKNRAKKAVKLVKKFVEKHMEAEGVKIGQDLNEKIWDRSAEKPPKKVRVRAAKFSGGIVEVSTME